MESTMLAVKNVEFIAMLVAVVFMVGITLLACLYQLIDKSPIHTQMPETSEKAE